LDIHRNLDVTILPHPSAHPAPVPAPEAARLAAALAAATDEYARRNPRSAEMAAAAARHLPGGSTRSSIWYAPFPLRMVRGEDCRLFDADGHEYVDFLGEFSAGIYGHSAAAVREAIAGALAEGLSLSAHNRWEGRLAALICERFASMELVRFTNSGTEANLLAIAAAHGATGRRTVLVFEGGYHGSVLSFLPGGEGIRVPHDFVIGRYNDAEGGRALIEQHAAGLAAILVEPMQGSAGCIPGSLEFLGSLRQGADAAGAALIFDEVQTSRLSSSGLQGRLGITPDLTTLGKYFGGGLAFGCFGGRRSIMERFDPRRPDALAHAGTFNNNTLTMAAGAAALSTLLTPRALEELNRRGDSLRAAMAALFERLDAPLGVTGLGSLMNIHPKVPAAAMGDARKLLFFALIEAGIYTAARGFIALSLPITEAHTARLLGALERFVHEFAPAMRL
jgi:glutamate-1-semialdehyde 2,1-aminomutase